MVQKLELTWVNKNKLPEVEPRILMHDSTFDYGDPDSENILIHGDNLLALKALEQDFAGRVKCIYIDPPYNTGAAFEHYDDNLEHSIWLNLMAARLKILRNLLSKDGFFCCHIDDSEGHYLKILLDEIFERQNYLTTLYIRVRYPEKTLKEDMNFHKEIEQIHIYRKTPAAIPNLDTAVVGHDKFIYRIVELTQPSQTIELGGKRVDIFQSGQYEVKTETGSKYGLKEIWASGTILDGNSSGRFFRDFLTGRYEQDGYGVLYKVYGIGDDMLKYRYFTGPKREGATKGKYYQGVPADKMDAEKNIRKFPIENFYDFAGSFGNCRQEGGVDFRSGKKPEILIHTLLKHFTNPGDLVLDSFLGSGTTAAVAHKMKRRWIGIEKNGSCHSHCIPRLQKVIDGEQGGISKSVGWQGGGGFKFYELAPTLIVKDKHGMEIFNPQYNPEMIAAAVAKHNGFTYSPDKDIFWKQGFSHENSFIYTTTNYLTAKMLDEIHGDMKIFETLLICAPAFDIGIGKRYDNINIKKIPLSLLEKCEYGVDSYDLKIISPPTVDSEEWEDDSNE